MSTVNTSGIPDLWPEEIVFAPMLSPKTILQHQAELLGKKASGYLQAKVTTSFDDRDTVLELVLVAPTLDGYSRPILTLRYNSELPYPCFISSDALNSRETLCDDPRQLFDRLAKVFSAPMTRSLIFSLLARISEDSEAMPDPH